MMQNTDYDVAVVGASIAGCTAATLYGRFGLNVALIERRADMAAYNRLRHADHILRHVRLLAAEYGQRFYAVEIDSHRQCATACM